MINLTIISENNKTIITKSLSNLSLNSFNSSENITIPYDNTIINIIQDSSSYTIQNFFGSLTGLNKEVTFLIAITIFILIIYFSINVLSKVKR